MNYLYYFLANCDRKNPISDLVGYLTNSLQPSTIAQLLAKVASGRNLSRAVDDVKFWLLRVQSKCTFTPLFSALINGS